MAWPGMARQGGARHGRARLGKAWLGMAGQGVARHFILEKVMEMENKTIFNYENEAKEIENRPVLDVFKPEASGFYQFSILTEPEKTFYTDDEGNVTEQIVMRILFNQKEMVWYVQKGKTPESAYYKLMYIGRYYNGLMGVTLSCEVTVSKNKDGKSMRKFQFINYYDIKKLEAENVNRQKTTKD